MNKNKEDNMINEKYSEIDKTEINKFKIFSSFFMITVLTILSRTTNRKEKNILEDSSKQIDDIYESISNQKIEFILKECFDNKKERSKYAILDFDMSNASQIQKEFLNDTARLITKFHEQTHKENNFRLEEDDEHYLDLTLDEAISLNIMLNDYSEEEITEIFGYKFMSLEKIKTSIKSSYNKLILYYMNAKEKSYISDIIKDEEKKKIFEDIEEKVLRFNQDTNKKNNNEIKKDKFYQYITRGSSEDYYYDDFILFISRAPFMGFMLNDVEKSKSEIKSIINDENLIKSLSRRSKLLEIGINNANKNYLKILEFEQEKNKKDKEKLLENIDKNSSSFFGMDINKTIKDISGSNVKEIASKIYDNNLIEKTVGLTFSQVKDKINFNKLDNQYSDSSINNLDFLVTVRRKKAFIRFFKNPKIVNDNQIKNDEEEKNKISSSNIEKEEVFTRKK